VCSRGKLAAMTGRGTALLGLLLMLSGSDSTAGPGPALPVATVTGVAVKGGPAPSSLSAQKRPDAPQLAPYVPTPQDVVDRMLKLANVGKNDLILDLGCGDGRIPISAARTYGARGIGVDIDPQRIAEANANAKAAGVTNLVTFKLENAMTTDLSQATVVTLYLLSSSNLKLRPILTRQLKPGTRIVAHNFAMGDWEAETIDTFHDKEGRTRTLYRWTTDGKVRQ
jgi:precorrin-6B methylase 2